MIKTNAAQFGLLDCNNFFVSCERLFNPELEKYPVIVLSNNDGCVVSRSDEAKALQIKMGTPLFKIKELVRQHNVRVFSSNFALYHSISNRIMQLLKENLPAIEVYSVDEAFLDLAGFQGTTADEFGKTLVKKVIQWTGIPVSLGIGPTKTLSKVANHIAKKNKAYRGVFRIEEEKKQHILSSMDIEDVWGIGPRLAPQLKILGIHNAYHLSQQDPIRFQKRFNKVVASIILELNGISTYPLEAIRSPKKQIMVSRSFGKKVTALIDLKQAIASHTVKALEKLRSQHSLARSISIFLQTNRFTAPGEPYHHQIDLKLPTAMDDTDRFLKVALEGVDILYCMGCHYKKAGVILQNISQKQSFQMDLFCPENIKNEKKMALLDNINQKIGAGTLKYAIEGLEKPWQTRSLYRSPCYTTCWHELPIVKSTF